MIRQPQNRPGRSWPKAHAAGSVAWRMEAMCEAAGLPLDRARTSGQLSIGEYDAMVERCVACESGAACLLWRLAEPETTGRVPGYCLNGEAIETLFRSG